MKSDQKAATQPSERLASKRLASKRLAWLVVCASSVLVALRFLRQPPKTECPAVCSALQERVSGAVSCDVEHYAFDWGNKICAGIEPLCVLRPESASDVAAAVGIANERRVPLSYRSGGHSYTCNSIKADSLHVDLRSLRSVALHGKELTFGTGHNMKTLLDALPEGKMIVHGQCPTVGAGGLFLHGGYHTTLTLKYGRGNDTVTAMQVVTATGAVLELSDASPPGAERELWQAMRQAGSSFAIATRLTVKVIDDLPPESPTDGGDFFVVDAPRAALLPMLTNASREAGLLNYIHVNGVARRLEQPSCLRDLRGSPPCTVPDEGGTRLTGPTRRRRRLPHRRGELALRTERAVARRRAGPRPDARRVAALVHGPPARAAG